MFVWENIIQNVMLRFLLFKCYILSEGLEPEACIFFMFKDAFIHLYFIGMGGYLKKKFCH